MESHIIRIVRLSCVRRPEAKSTLNRPDGIWFCGEESVSIGKIQCVWMVYFRETERLQVGLVSGVVRHIFSGMIVLAAFVLSTVFFVVHAQAQSFPGGGVVLGGGMSTSITSLSDNACASAPDPVACIRDMAAGSGQKPLRHPSGTVQGNEEAAPSMPNPVVSSIPEEPGEFEKFVSSSVGKPLAIYGRKLFAGVPNTFSPLDNIPVTGDYMVGPGDELVVRAWGQVDFETSVVVDRNGSVYLPQVGNVNVAGCATMHCRVTSGMRSARFSATLSSTSR